MPHARIVRRVMILAHLALLGALAPAGVVRAAPSCRVPSSLPVPHPEEPSTDQPRRLLPIGGYTLALIWSPQQCRSGASGAEGIACDDARGFVLHGLWPDGKGRDWPQYCRPAAILPAATLRAHYCATPSAQLLQHEWAKHGTCMPGQTPERYFALSNRLFARIRSPDMGALSRRPGLTAGGFAQAFAVANSGLRADMIRLNIDRAGWLGEVWLCLDTAFRPQRCPATQGGASGAAPMQIRPPMD